MYKPDIRATTHMEILAVGHSFLLHSGILKLLDF
jgi:hypothetical protein